MPVNIARSVPLALLVGSVFALSGCNVKAHGDHGENASITIGSNEGDPAIGNGQQGLSINVPGLAAKVKLPDFHIGDDTRIEDMPMFPGTEISGVNISAQNRDGADNDSAGDVTMAFTAPDTPDKVVSWYKTQARRNGWDAVPTTGEAQFEAIKREGGHGPTHFALQIAPASGGSSGRFIVTGR
ncbi:hypothetical protein [Sphingomonas abietis]|uniref:Lipoprotein n=1 Tax=Sphingomonas abietis TaxID=3012344 RepID=A0ABY7NP38_9SPHN|nr:hypothetical protein [Sphingomonas abietis]WBO23292.1 hypothetical protein PBT88_03910 [Sphingomonas abietis]